MRELTSVELQAVSGGAMAIVVRKEPLLLRLLLKVLEFLKRPECGPVRKLAA